VNAKQGKKKRAGNVGFCRSVSPSKLVQTFSTLETSAFNVRTFLRHFYTHRIYGHLLLFCGKRNLAFPRERKIFLCFLLMVSRRKQLKRAVKSKEVRGGAGVMGGVDMFRFVCTGVRVRDAAGQWGHVTAAREVRLQQMFSIY
jgi:hypothetical protein